MSHKAYIGVLAHYQPIGCHASTRLPQDVADDLVQRMAAERLSQKVIRLLPPDSPFPILKPPYIRAGFVPEILPPIELPGLHLQFPKNCEGVSMASVRANWDWRWHSHEQHQQRVTA